MKYGIIGALDTEIILLKDNMKIKNERNICGLDFFEGTIRDKEVTLVCSSVGKVNATVCTDIIVREFNSDAVINVGIAGGMANHLQTLDIVISDQIEFHDQDQVMKKYYPFRSHFEADGKLIELCRKACNNIEDRIFQYYVGKIATGDVFVTDSKIRDDILQKFNPYCVEMEGAAIAQVAHMNNRPFVIIRSISDNADENANQTYDNFMDQAAKHSSQIVLKMLEMN